MKIAWNKNAKTKRQPVVASAKPGLPFGAEGDNNEDEKKGSGETGTDYPGTKPPDTAKSLQHQGNKLAEEGKYHEALRATEVEPSWPEAWVTLGRAQLNFGEPDKAIESFDRALAIKPDYSEAKSDRETASRLVRKRGQLHSSGDLNANKRRFTVGGNSEKGEKSEEEEA